MNCWNCNREIQNDVVYCTYCGARLESLSDTAAKQKNKYKDKPMKWYKYPIKWDKNEEFLLLKVVIADVHESVQSYDGRKRQVEHSFQIQRAAG